MARQGEAWRNNKKPGFKTPEELQPDRYKTNVEEVRAAGALLNARICPNDGGKLCKDGHCRRCSFRLVVVPPVEVDYRVDFNRIWQRAFGSRFPVVVS